MNAWSFVVICALSLLSEAKTSSGIRTGCVECSREAPAVDLTSLTNSNLPSGPDSVHSGPSRRLISDIQDIEEEEKAVDDRLDPETNEAIAKCDSQLKVRASGRRDILQAACLCLRGVPNQGSKTVHCTQAAHPEELLPAFLFTPLAKTPFHPIQTQVLGVLLAIDHTQADTILPYFMKRLTNMLWEQGMVNTVLLAIVLLALVRSQNLAKVPGEIMITKPNVTQESRSECLEQSWRITRWGR